MSTSGKRSDGCKFPEKLFAAYAGRSDECLSLVDQSAVDDHLEECPTCRATFWQKWAAQQAKQTG